jgi:DNA repair exonuclease SbcCD ATPase subunit
VTTTIKKDFQDMRERIEEKMSMIRKQFKKMESKIDERKTEYETKTNDVITKLKENMKPAQHLRVTIAQIKESASNMQIFLCLKELESMVSKEDVFLSSILLSIFLNCFRIMLIFSSILSRMS